MKFKLKVDHSTYKFITSLIKLYSLTSNSSHKILTRKHEMKNARIRENTRKTTLKTQPNAVKKNVPSLLKKWVYIGMRSNGLGVKFGPKKSATQLVN